MSGVEGSPWENTWNKLGTDAPWQVPGPHPLLVKHIDVLTAGKTQQRILVPLCGMSYDLLWLANQGHSVVGVESVRVAIEAFFKNNELEYTLDAINMAPSGAYVFKAKEKDITIYQCDFLNFRKSVAGGAFNAVWDRASLIAVLHNDSTDQDIQIGRNYLNVLHALLEPEGKCMIETFRFNPADRKSLPRPALCTADMLKSMCGVEWSMTEVDLVHFQAGEGFQNSRLPYKYDIAIDILIPK